MIEGGLPVIAVTREPSAEFDISAWPATLPCVRQVLDHGLELGALTILVGENGSGKSTLIEAIAQRFGLSPEGASTGARHSTRPSESPLWRALHPAAASARPSGASSSAETMHGYYGYLDDPELNLRYLID